MLNNILELSKENVVLSEIKVMDVREDSFDVYIAGYYNDQFNSNILTIFVEDTIDIALSYITNTGLTNEGAVAMAKQIAATTEKVVNLTEKGNIVVSIEP